MSRHSRISKTLWADAFGGQQVSQTQQARQTSMKSSWNCSPEFQAKASPHLTWLYVSTNTGSVVPLSAVTTVTPGTQPLSVNHSGEVPAVTLSFDLAKGYTLSDAVTAMKKATDAVGVPGKLHPGSFQGTAAAFEQSTQNMGALLLVAMLVVYIILGILYESLIHPLTILSGLPSAAMGALLILFLVGMPLTLSCLCRGSMIMLIGIAQEKRHHDDRFRPGSCRRTNDISRPPGHP